MYANSLSVSVFTPGSSAIPCIACLPDEVSTTGYSRFPARTWKKGTALQSVAKSRTKFTLFPTTDLSTG
ncbi:MAG TPA: hypothetical protein DCS42_06400 [Nitrospiraceae bacterium]|nr:hypothetical protein [Nitrospiraceae bacterium]